MTWKLSWKKFCVEYMWGLERYMIYPSYQDQWSWGTNHIEIGEHIKSERDRKRFKKGFVVPLVDEGWVEEKGGIGK